MSGACMTYHHLCNIENPRLHFFRAPHWLRRGGRMQTSGITDLIEASPCNDASKKALACELSPCKLPFTASASVQNAISQSDSTLSWHPDLTRETRPVPAFSVHRCRGARGEQGEDVSRAVRHVQGVQKAGERGGGKEETGESQGTILGLNRRYVFPAAFAIETPY